MKYNRPILIRSLLFTPDSKSLIATGFECDLTERKFGRRLVNIPGINPKVQFIANRNLLVFSDIDVGTGLVDYSTGDHQFLTGAYFSNFRIVNDFEIICSKHCPIFGKSTTKWNIEDPCAPKKIWEYEEGKEIGSVSSLKILTHDRKTLIGWRSPPENIWQTDLVFCSTEDGKVIRAWENYRYFPGGDFLLSPNGKQILITDEQVFRVFDIETGKCLRRVKKPCPGIFWKMVLHPNQKYYISLHLLGAYVFVWDVETFEIVRSYKWPIKKGQSLAVSPDGLLCAIGDTQGHVVVWDWDE